MLARKIGLAALGSAVVAILGFASWVLWSQGPAAWTAAGGFAALAALVIAFLAVVLTPGRRTLRVVPARGGVGLGNSPALTAILLLMAAGFALVVVGFVVAWIASGSRPVDAVGPTVVLFLVAAAGVPFVVALARGRYRLGGLVLTPDSIAYASYTTEHALPWDAVLGTAPGAQPGSLRLQGRDGQEISIAVGLLRTSPGGLESLIDFYRRHPGLRAELADRRCLDRFATA